MREKDFNTNLVPTASYTTWLALYDKHMERSVALLEGGGMKISAPMLRGMLKLNELPQTTFNILLILNTNGWIKQSATELTELSTLDRRGVARLVNDVLAKLTIIFLP